MKTRITARIIPFTLAVGIAASHSADAWAARGAKPTADKSVPKKKSVAATKQYKRVHQAALDLITAGKTEQAVAYLKELTRTNPKDPETQFMLAFALVRQGKKDEAIAAMRSALSLGLPPGRIIAGPRNLLGPLGEPAVLRDLLGGRPGWTETLDGSADTDAAWQPIHGPMVGNVTEQSAAIWIRAARAGIYRAVAWEIARPGDKPGRLAAEAKAQATPDTDYTAVIPLTGLAADRYYAYSVGPDGSRAVPMSSSRYFRTAPAPGAKAKFALAFGGGAGFVPENERMWNTIDAHKPDLLLLLGDNVYIDHPESPDMQRYCYYRRQSRPEFRALVAHTPVYSIWDDHDFGTNDCWGGPEIDSPTWKRSVWNVFHQNWVNPGYAGGKDQLGCWYAFTWDNVEFFMLDCRYYRTNPKAKSTSMLGPVQKEWFKGKLRASKATFKVICSSVPFDYRTKGDSLDTWNGYRAERDEIFGLIDNHNIGGVILMSADRHRSDLWKIDRQHGYPLYELSSSRLTNQHVHQTMPAAEFSYNRKQSFGLVEFDTTAADPTVTYRIVTIDGQTPHTFTVKRSQLSHKSQ
ncbi:MAG: alkaline phosphatase D family protein [Phycisphaerae bacterium]|nr:alkaline phosphatase D family protein [Phycisphaerae bacterium]